jgi:hypothetical protein
LAFGIPRIIIDGLNRDAAQALLKRRASEALMELLLHP